MPAHSQINKHNCSFGIALGTSTPLGEFEDEEAQTNFQNTALTGFHFSANFSFKPWRHFGATSLFTINNHRIDANIDEIITLVQWFYPGYSIKIDAGSWLSANLMAGGIFSLPYKKFEFNLKALAGISYTKIPEVNFNATDSLTSLHMTSNDASAWAIALNAGIEIQYNILQKLALSLSIDDFFTRPEFEVATTSDLFEPVTEDVKPALNMLNVSFGIKYRI